MRQRLGEEPIDNVVTSLGDKLRQLSTESVSARQTAHEFVRGVLRRAILNGELPGGTRLVQAELAAVLEVSTTPVREALRDLATEGLILFDPHRGAVVHELSGDELHEIYDIRMLLEPLAIRQAVSKVTEPLLEQLRRLHRKMLDEPHSAEWVDYNRIFHMAVFEMAASPRLVGIIRSLQDASVMYIGASLKHVPGLREEANEDHARILEGLERRDTEAVVAAITKHLAVSLRAFDETDNSNAGSTSD
ncbi:MAG TPA: GntR family transcriptional regulator [Acidimicrobiia bacterium]|nr:GntR family transcriptional regulator [Acidimicrobiia bacterium]